MVERVDTEVVGDRSQPRERYAGDDTSNRIGDVVFAAADDALDSRS